MNWPIGACPEDDLGRAFWSLFREPQGEGGGGPLFSELSLGPDIVGAARDDRDSYAALLRFEVGGFPVCCVNFAFSVAMAAAASGNIALMVEGSRPECLLTPRVLGGREREFLDPSAPNLFIASLRRLDIGSNAVISLTMLAGVEMRYLCQNLKATAHQTLDGFCPSAATLE